MITAHHLVFGSQYWHFVPEPEYQAVLNVATANGYIKPHRKEMYFQNEMVKALKLAGIWAKLDQLYLWYHSAGFNFSNINFIHPAFILTRNTTLDNSFINKEGARVSGLGNHFTSTYNPQAESGKYQLGDASYGYVNGTSTNVDGTYSAIQSNGSSELRFRQHASRQYFQQGGGYTAGVPAGAAADKSNKFYISTRTASNNKVFEDGVKLSDGAISYLGTAGTTPSSDVNYSFLFGCRSIGLGGFETLRMAFTGGNLTEAECVAFNTIWNNYKNSI